MPPPHSTRYKCGFPGCTEYASTDEELYLWHDLLS